MGFWARWQTGRVPRVDVITAEQLFLCFLLFSQVLVYYLLGSATFLQNQSMARQVLMLVAHVACPSSFNTENDAEMVSKNVV